MANLIQDYGLWLLFVVIALESAGVPLPGETSLVAAGVLASKGHLNIGAVIAVAAIAAILGDNLGYWIGRTGGRKLLTSPSPPRPGWWPRWLWPVRMIWDPVQRFAVKAMPASERFFERHGPKTIFLARFIAGLRVTAAWMAGIAHMDWRKFFLWNALGGIVWATGIGLIAYYFGHAVADAIAEYGLLGAAVAIGIAVFVLVGFHFWKKRRWEAEEEAA